MKKFTYLSAIMAVLLFAGCNTTSGDSNGSDTDSTSVADSSSTPETTAPKSNAELIIGKWRYVSMVMNGDSTDMESIMENYMVYNEDGSYRNGGVVDGVEEWNDSSYKVEGDSVAIDGTLQIKQLDEKFLVLSNESEGIVLDMVYRKVE